MTIRYCPYSGGACPAEPSGDTPLGIAQRMTEDLCARGYAPEAGVEPWLEAISAAITREREKRSEHGQCQ